MTVHEGITKINELLNLKLTKDIDNIKVSIHWEVILNKDLINKIKKFLANSSPDVELFTPVQIIELLYRSLKSANIELGEPRDKDVRSIVEVFNKLIRNKHIISFSHRIRYGEVLAIWSGEGGTTHINTTNLDIKNQNKLYKEVISKLVNKLFKIQRATLSVNNVDLFRLVVDNDIKTMKGLEKRGYSHFAIASWFNYKDDILHSPFMSDYSGVDFFKIILEDKLFKNIIPPSVADRIPPGIEFWTVVSEQSLLLNKVQNLNPDRRVVNQGINAVLNNLADEYIRRYLQFVAMAKSQSPVVIALKDTNSPIKDIKKALQNQLAILNTPIPSKEELVQSMIWNLSNSKIRNYDFSTRRKDHLVLNKLTRKRIIDIL